jgi:alpha-1,4-digalacturonate transport system permease protein
VAGDVVVQDAAQLAEFPPSLLPYATEQVTVEGYDKPLNLFTATLPDGSTKVMAEVRRVGTVAQMVDPAKRPPRSSRSTSPIAAGARDAFRDRKLHRAVLAFRLPAISQELGLRHRDGDADHAADQFHGGVRAVEIQFRGRNVVLLLIVGTLMVPLSVILVPLYSVISAVGLFDSLWGVILPTVATPTGVFLLRQYMLTIPDELIDAARMDKASEWQIYWRIILPLAAPALAVLAIFSVVWRWNDFLWPLIVLSRKELYTLQVGLNTYAGELNVQWHFILAMTVVTMIPVVLVFVFLQRFITAGIAGTGLK